VRCSRTRTGVWSCHSSSGRSTIEGREVRWQRHRRRHRCQITCRCRYSDRTCPTCSRRGIDRDIQDRQPDVIGVGQENGTVTISAPLPSVWSASLPTTTPGHRLADLGNQRSLSSQPKICNVTVPFSSSVPFLARNRHNPRLVKQSPTIHPRLST